MRPLIAFDLDGTLIDSKRDLAESANEMLATYGAAPLAEAEVAGMVGDGAKQLVQRALDAARGDDRRFSCAGPFPGDLRRPARSCTLARIHGLPDAVAAAADERRWRCSRTSPRALETLLDGFGLSRFFRWVIGGDSGFPRKPDPSGLSPPDSSGAASTPGACLMVGDSMMDVETARSAGAAVCVAEYGFGHLRRPSSWTARS